MLKRRGSGEGRVEIETGDVPSMYSQLDARDV